MNARRAAAVAALALMAALGVWAIARPEATEAGLDARVREIASGLRCPVCQYLSVADSPSALAADMRATIRSKLAAGESRDQIVRFFTDRYGTWIVFEPPARGIGIIAWVAPAAGLLAGAGFVALAARRWRRSPGRAIGDAERVRLSEALARYGDAEDSLEP